MMGVTSSAKDFSNKPNSRSGDVWQRCVLHHGGEQTCDRCIGPGRLQGTGSLVFRLFYL